MEDLPEVHFRDAGIPYLMATYKLHKLQYRWLTNAAHCIFSGPATIITQMLHLINQELEEWCKLRSEKYRRFGKVTTNLYWAIDSLFDFTLNLPENIHPCMLPT